MQLLFFPVISILSILSRAEQTSDPLDPVPCNNFFEYVCTKKYPRIPSRLQDVRRLNISDDIDQHQEYVFQATSVQSLWQAIDPDIVSKWLVQFNTYWDGVKWENYQKNHETFLSLPQHEKFEKLEKMVEPYNNKILTIFYKSLKKSVINLAELNIPISTHNHFYHGIFDDVRDIHISNIRAMSKYNDEMKDILIERVKSVKVIFPYLEYNDIRVWRNAKSAYEKEYYRLKTIVNETQIPPDTVEKIIRVAAVNAAMEIFEKYITTFTPKFVFQHVTAASSMFAFNFQNEIHISVFTMFNPNSDPGAVYNKFLYALCHELQHVHYNIDPPPFESDIWTSEKQCVVDNLDNFANIYKYNLSDLAVMPFSYEDSANVAGLRLMLLYVAQRTSDNNEIRSTLERSMSVFCSNNRTNRHHNPNDVSINVAVSQMPTFNSLYNCTSGDRMYVAPENYCRTLNMDIDENDYITQKIEKNDLLLLSQFLNVLESTADKLDAANITTFEEKIFDITFEDVESREEELEGSTEGSESISEKGDYKGESEEEKELDEIPDGLGDSEEEIQKAEIVSSTRYPFSWPLLIIGISSFSAFF